MLASDDWGAVAPGGAERTAPAESAMPPMPPLPPSQPPSGIIPSPKLPPPNSIGLPPGPPPPPPGAAGCAERWRDLQIRDLQAMVSRLEFRCNVLEMRLESLADIVVCSDPAMAVGPARSPSVAPPQSTAVGASSSSSMMPPESIAAASSSTMRVPSVPDKLSPEVEVLMQHLPLEKF